jgi:hypothetical protein
MEHIHTSPRLVFSNDLNLFILPEVDDIFQRCRFVRLNGASSALSRYDFEIDEMDVYWMRPSTRFIDESPLFKRPLWWFRKNTVRDIFEANAVDSPLTVSSLENEFVVDSGARPGLSECGKRSRERTVPYLRRDSTSYNPFHTKNH